MRSLLSLITILLWSGISYSQTVSLFAGTPQTIGHNATTTTKLAAKFAYPHGMAYDSKGNLWITNFGGPEDINDPTSPEAGHTITVIMPNGNVMTRAGQYGASCLKSGSGINSKFSNPAGIAVGPGDTIYVADASNHVIRKIDPLLSNLQVQNVVILAGKYYQPSPTSQCYTTYPGFANGKASVAQFNYPVDLDVDNNGNIYVADRDNHCIRLITPSGQVSTFAGVPGTSGNKDDNDKLLAQFSYPSGVHYDDATGVLYVAEYGNGQLRKIDASGKVTTVMTNLDAIALYQPQDVVKDNQNNIYVSSYHRILKRKDTKTSIFAGDIFYNGYTGYVNDTGTAARFNQIKEMVVNPDNIRYVYAADQYNQVIRKIVICEDYKPTVTASSNTTTCFGDTVTLKGSNGFLEYRWSTGQTTQEIKLFNKGTFNVTLTVLNDDYCYGVSEPVKVTINQLSPTVQVIGLKTFCTGGSVLFNGQSGLDYYNWQKDGVTVLQGVEGVASSYTATLNGNYVLIGTKGPCTGSSVTQVVDVVSKYVPKVEIYAGDTMLCAGKTVTLRTVETYDTYQWKKGSTNLAADRYQSITSGGSYTVYVTHNQSNCSGTSYPVAVTELPSPPKPTLSYNNDSTVLISSTADNYQWYFYDSLIVGANTKEYTPTKPGYYKVEVTNTYGCKSVSDAINFGNTSINNISLENFIQLYPNPGNGIFNLEINVNAQTDVIVQIFDAVGKNIYVDEDFKNTKSTINNIDLSKFGKGIYFMQININNQLIHKKLVIE